MTAIELRALAREALLEAGARGFVRFLPEGDGALLVTDAPKGCGGIQTELLMSCMAARGFVCKMRGNLLALTPGDELLAGLAREAVCPESWDWESELAPLLALAARWMRAPEAPVGEAGRRLAIETARLLWKPRAQVLGGLGALRAGAAVLQRNKEPGGLRLCGGMLALYGAEQEKTEFETGHAR